MLSAMAILRLNRAEKRSALNDGTSCCGIRRVPCVDSRGLKAVALHGEGKHFCAGLDLSELKEGDAVGGLMHPRLWHRRWTRGSACWW